MNSMHHLRRFAIQAALPARARVLQDDTNQELKYNKGDLLSSWFVVSDRLEA